MIYWVLLVVLRGSCSLNWKQAANLVAEAKQLCLPYPIKTRYIQNSSLGHRASLISGLVVSFISDSDSFG
jgi:hypothetical protein